MPRRIYRQISSGKTVKGVTTIISILEKKALLFWAFKQGMSNFERLMTEFAMMGKRKELLIPIEDIEYLIKDFKTTGLYDKRDKAANAGTLGHSYIENYIKKLPDPDITGIAKDIVSKAKGCYLTFLNWEKNNQIKVIDSEVELTSEKYAFGGTIDHVIQTVSTPINRVEILDIKTGKDIYLEAKIQIKTYSKLYEEHNPEIKVVGFHILRLGETGEFTHKYFSSLDEGYWNIFVNLMNTNLELERLGEKL